MATAEVGIASPWGMHARLAFHLSALCRTFPCAIHIAFRGQRADAKEMTDILLLAAGPDAVVTLEAEGEGEEDALEKVRQFLLVDAKAL
ncbi:MAG: HPr family phosphocarrier protein [Nitrospinae bacterium]|nr:HPr family phosphocarrier protein [Nitrospinota bacterium]